MAQEGANQNEQPVLTYPYLGRMTFDDDPDNYYVVMFTSPDKGVVVVNHTKEDSGVKFGKYGNFAEDVFEILPPEIVVRLSN